MHQPDVLTALAGERVIPQPTDLAAVHPYLAGAGNVDAGRKVEERALARTAASHHRHALSGGHRERDAVECHHARASFAIDLGDLDQAQSRGGCR